MLDLPSKTSLEQIRKNVLAFVSPNERPKTKLKKLFFLTSQIPGNDKGLSSLHKRKLFRIMGNLVCCCCSYDEPEYYCDPGIVLVTEPFVEPCYSDRFYDSSFYDSDFDDPDPYDYIWNVDLSTLQQPTIKLTKLNVHLCVQATTLSFQTWNYDKMWHFNWIVNFFFIDFPTFVFRVSSIFISNILS